MDVDCALRLGQTGPQGGAGGWPGGNQDPEPRREQLLAESRDAYRRPARTKRAVHADDIGAASYDDIVRLHLIPGLGRIALAKLTPAEVQAFLSAKRESGLSARRVQMLHAILTVARLLPGPPPPAPMTSRGPSEG